ncbi:uncharacterized protein LOC123705042 [Colias croceus]|uniref:uncharacterized protein LOC123705042 n=1 Tax=Colias crocea TaxID=72248 RepID=UPI001E27BD60|nr:uncharacterized protein LOC123705042 [Colias croceus]
MNKKKIAPELSLAAILSGSISILLSIFNIILCVIALLYRYDCEAGSVPSASGSDYFLTTLYRVYIQDDACPDSPAPADLTRSYSVFVLTSITLSFAVVHLISAAALMSSAAGEDSARYISVTAYIYVGVSVAVLVVDITFATHFGMDYTTLKKQLDQNSAGVPFNYETDILRMSALLLMSLVLKGYVFHLINTVLLVCLIVYVVEHHKSVNRNEHAIHKLGVLNAYDYPRSLESTWPVRSDIYSEEPRGNSHLNRAFNHDDEIPRHRDNPLAEISSRPERSDSWLRPQSNHPPGVGSRPFSYLEEPKRSPKPTTPEPNWRRDWPPPPPVPAPDYSPPARRLKSALKSGYP